MSSLLIDGKTVYYCNNQEMLCVLEARFASDKDLIVASAPVQEDETSYMNYVWITDEEALEIAN